MPDTVTDSPEVENPQPVDYSVLDAFQGTIRPTRTSIFYQAGLLLLTAAMVLLPLIYLGLIALAGYGVYYHAVYHYEPIMGVVGGRSGRVWLFKLLVYAAPMVVGLILIFFMIKPLFAGRPPKAQPYGLNPDAEPLLFAFIARICKLVGAPMPTRIDLDCDLNASASFRRGFFSLFGTDLVLTIGLPLVAGLTMRQFAGVLAHEFGHFTQGLAMRLTYIIRSINFWFARVVYERDAWDVYLEELSQNAEDWRITVIMLLARLGVWFSRMFLLLLMGLGNVLSCFMLRQMEFDADAYEIRLAGSAAFEATMQRIQSLGAALQQSYKDMRVAWNLNRHLPDNLSHFMLNKLGEMPSESVKKAVGQMVKKKTGLVDTHPSDEDRAQRARQAGEPGIFLLEDPATKLFANFEVPARLVTLMHYQDSLGLDVTPAALTPTELKFPPTEAAAADSSAPSARLDAYFYGLLPLMKPLTISPAELTPPARYKDAVQTIKSLPSRMTAIQGQVETVMDRLEKAGSKRLRARQARSLMESGVMVNGPDFGLPDPSIPAAQKAEAEAAAEQARARQKLELVMAEVKGRLTAALCLLQAPQTSGIIPDAGALLRKALVLIHFLNQMAAWHDMMKELEKENAGLSIMLEYQMHDSPPPMLTAKIHEKSSVVAGWLNALADKTAKVMHPFSPPENPLAIRDFLNAEQPDLSRPNRLCEECQARLEKLSALGDEVLLQLVEIAQTIAARF